MYPENKNPSDPSSGETFDDNLFDPGGFPQSDEGGGVYSGDDDPDVFVPEDQLGSEPLSPDMGDATFDFEDVTMELINTRMGNFGKMIGDADGEHKDLLEDVYVRDNYRALGLYKVSKTENGDIELTNDPNIDIEALNMEAVESNAALSDSHYMMAGGSSGIGVHEEEAADPSPRNFPGESDDSGDYGDDLLPDSTSGSEDIEQVYDEEVPDQDYPDDSGYSDEDQGMLEDVGSFEAPVEEEPAANVPDQDVAISPVSENVGVVVSEPPVEAVVSPEPPQVAKQPPVVAQPAVVPVPMPSFPEVAPEPLGMDASSPLEMFYTPAGDLDLWATYSPHVTSSEKSLLKERLRYIEGLPAGEARHEQASLALVLIGGILCRRASYTVPEGLRMMRGSLDGFSRQQAEWQTKLDADQESRKNLGEQWREAIEGFGSFRVSQAEMSKKQNGALRSLSEEIRRSLKSFKSVSSSGVSGGFKWFMIGSVCLLLAGTGSIMYRLNNPMEVVGNPDPAVSEGLRFEKVQVSNGGASYYRVMSPDGSPASPFKYGEGVIYKGK